MNSYLLSATLRRSSPPHFFYSALHSHWVDALRIRRNSAIPGHLATASPEDTVTQLFAEKFAEEVHDLSNGAMRIQVYANSTLGGDRDLLETCADGDIPFVVQNTAPQVSFMKDLAVFDLPCVFDSLDDCRKKLDDPDFYNLISQSVHRRRLPPARHGRSRIPHHEHK
ncbi:MAG: hypothetical protein ACLT76_08320 [Clostridium fessum]